MNKEEFNLKYPKGPAYSVTYMKAHVVKTLWFRYLKDAKNFQRNLKDTKFRILKRYKY